MKVHKYEFVVISALAILLSFTSIAQADSITINMNPGAALEKDIRDTNGRLPVIGGIITGVPDYGYLTLYGYDGAGAWDPWAVPPAPVQNMVDLAADIGMSYCRYPGGGIKYYNWKHAVGPLNLREPIYLAEDDYGNPLTDQPIMFGVSEFLKVSNDIGCKPIIVLSYRTISLENTDYPYMDGADLVEYLNAASGTNPNGGTAWADIRDSDRVRLGMDTGPWNVEFFEYGNETYSGAVLAPYDITSADYIGNYMDYRTAMTDVDGNIKLGAVLSGGFKTWSSHRDWTVDIITGIGQAADYFIMHTYIPSNKEDCCNSDDQACQSIHPAYPICTINAEDLFRLGLAGTNGYLQYTYEEINSLIYELAGEYKPIAITEYNGGFVQSEPVPYRHSLGNALINADLIRQLMHADNIFAANYHQYANAYFSMVREISGIYTIRPNYYPAYFYHNYFGDVLLKRKAVQVTTNNYTYTESDPYYDTSYRVKPSSGTYHFEELLQNELSGEWNVNISQPAGVISAVDDDNGMLTIEFGGSDDVDYYHTYMRTAVKTDTWHRLSYLIKTDNFIVSDEGMYLAAVSGDNLVENPGFEDDIDYLYWDEPSQGQPDGASRSIDEDISHSGNKSLRIDFSGTHDVSYWQTYQFIDAEPETDYLLEAYVKTEAITTSSGMRLEIYDGSRWIATTALTGTNDWVHFELPITTAPGTNQIRIRPRRYSKGGSEIISGTAWFDGFKVSIKHVSDQLDKDNAWRYITTDFKSKSTDDNGDNTANIDVYAARNTDGLPISGTVRIKDVKLRELVQGNYGAVPYLSVNASRSISRDKAYLMVVNKDMINPLTAQITINGLIPTTASARTLNANAVDATMETGLYNPGFEDYRDFYKWNLSDPPGVTTSIDMTESYSENKSAKVVFDGTRDVNYYQTYQTINQYIKAGTPYLLEGYIKTENITTANGLGLEIVDNTGNAVLGATQYLNGTNDWTYISREFTTRSVTTSIRVRPRRQSGAGNVSGTGWVDHLKISEINIGVTEDNIGPVSNGFEYEFPPHSLTALEIDGLIDSDKDEMSDDFEDLYSLNPNDPDDADDDNDNDGLTNLQEFQAGADPTDSDTDDDGIQDGDDICPLAHPVKIADTAQYFPDLQSAYTSGINMDILKIQFGSYIETLYFNESKSVTIEGGYNCVHSEKTGITTVIGDVNISDGTVTIGDFVLE